MPWATPKATSLASNYKSTIKSLCVDLPLFVISHPLTPLCTRQATAKDSTLFKHLVTRWKLTPLPPSPTNTPRTQVDLSLAYAFVSPFHAAAVGTVWEKVSGMMVDGFEKRVVQVYGKS